VRQRFHAGGVDGLHLLHQGKDAIELVQGGAGLGLGELQSGQVGDAFDVGKGRDMVGARLARRVMLKLEDP
jgi:hypothetical protein